MSSIDVRITGMHCAACVARVERVVSRVEGVESVAVNLATHRASIQGDVDLAVVTKAVERIGFGLERDLAIEAPTDDLRPRLIGAVMLTIPIVAISMLLHPRPEWVNVLLAVMTFPVTFVFGWVFFRQAWVAARGGQATMDTLVALGGGAAYAVSFLGLFLHSGHMQSEHIYFEGSATIVSLILLGRHLESRARRGATDAIRKLMELRPDRAIVVRGGQEVEVDAASVQMEEAVRLKPGSRVPVDGVVLEGASEIDESMLTGEPLPVAKTVGDTVSAGTMQGNGSLLVRATATGGGTRLAQIARAVERAQSTKPDVQRLVDRVSSVFVPIVIAIAALTFLGWLLLGGLAWDQAALRAAAVLVVACPCALGLATPTAIVAGAGRGAELGVLIRDGEALERAGKLRLVLFDKTGTLTLGRPSVTELVGDESALAAAAALESLSEHPVAKAVVSEANRRGVPIPLAEDFVAVPGKGARGIVEGREVRVGSAAWIGHDSEARVVVEIDGAVAAEIHLADQLRPEAEEAVRRLQSLGIRVETLTGDRHEEAQRVAAQLGLDAVHAEVSPEQKAAKVQEAQRAGTTVAMVGDGINDTVALAQADLGVAMGSGADVALESAGVALTRSDPRQVATAVRIARSTLSTIRWNLAWAFSYNAVLIPMAVAGKLSPMAAAAAMAFSSLLVVGNALRLRRSRLDA